MKKLTLSDFAVLHTPDIMEADSKFPDVYLSRKLMETAFINGIGAIIGWLEHAPLITPDSLSLNQFEPYYRVEQKLVKSQKEFWGIK